MSIAINESVALQTTTLRHIERNKAVSLAQRLQNYRMFPLFLKKHKKEQKGGYESEWEFNVDRPRTTRSIGLYEQFTPSQRDYVKPCRVRWGAMENDWSMDSMEADFNSGDPKILDLGQLRDDNMWIDIIETLETRLMECPAAGDTRSILGIFYWLFTEKQATGSWTNFGTASSGGFLNVNRAEASGGPGGIDAATYTQSGNFTWQYANETRADMVYKMRVACDKTKFLSPMPFKVSNPGMDTSPNRVVMTDQTRRRSYEDIMLTQNDQNGDDLDPYFGKGGLRGMPVLDSPYLEENYSSDGFIMGLDFSQIFPVVANGWFFRRMMVPSASMPSVSSTIVRLIAYTKCYCRRNLWIISK